MNQKHFRSTPAATGWVKMRDIVPAIVFAQNFSKRFEKAAVEKFGNIVPNDQRALHGLAKDVLTAMEPK